MMVVSKGLQVLGGVAELVRRRKKQLCKLWSTSCVHHHLTILVLVFIVLVLVLVIVFIRLFSLCFIVLHLCDSIPKWRQFHKLWGHRDQNDFAILTTWRVTSSSFLFRGFLHNHLTLLVWNKQTKHNNNCQELMVFYITVMHIVPYPYSGLKVGLALLGGGTTIKTPSDTVANINSFQIHI